MTVTVEEEEGEDIGIEASALRIAMVEEEEKDMKEEGVLAMGTDEKFAQRPLVMGVSCRRPHGKAHLNKYFVI